MNTSLSVLVIFLLVVFSSTLQAQETLPPYHWANAYIDYLKVRGHLPELSLIDRPFSRQQIAKQLLQVDSDGFRANRRDRTMRKCSFVNLPLR